MEGAADLYYGDDREYAVEQFDKVDLRFDGSTFDGEIRKLHPRLRMVTVRFEDYRDTYRTTSNGRSRSVRVPVADVDLIARDI
jgi:hypothetical protein